MALPNEVARSESTSHDLVMKNEEVLEQTRKPSQEKKKRGRPRKDRELIEKCRSLTEYFGLTKN